MNLIERVRKTERLSSDIYLIRIESERISSSASAGQFVNIKCPGPEVYLRRPISICSIDRSEKTIDIVFQIRGKGTRLLSDIKAGDTLDILGPLGRGFTICPEHKNILVAGGGIGIFPLLQVLKDHPAERKTALLGFRNKSAVVMEDEFNKYSTDLKIATDDGSYGIQGFVTALLQNAISEDRPDMVYICGPAIMMEQCVKLLKEKDIPCEVSMEQRMGCGMGACLVCACKTRSGSDWDYSHVCKDGPVFSGDRIIFESE